MFWPDLSSSFPAYRDPLIYNLSVTRELLKQVYITERLRPPTSLSTIQSAYSTLWARASNPVYWRESARNGELARVGVYAVEAYGIFKVRRNTPHFFRLSTTLTFGLLLLDWRNLRTRQSYRLQLALDLIDLLTNCLIGWSVVSRIKSHRQCICTSLSLAFKRFG